MPRPRSPARKPDYLLDAVDEVLRVERQLAALERLSRRSTYDPRRAAIRGKLLERKDAALLKAALPEPTPDCFVLPYRVGGWGNDLED